MRSEPKTTLFQSVRWLLLGAVLLPAVATTSVGIVILALWRVGGDIALGVLTTCFAVFTIAGSATTLYVLHRRSRLERMRVDFVANVSHELRTPLSSIRMFVDTLRLGRVRTDAERDECLDELDKQTTRLTKLVEQLLTFRESALAEPTTSRQIVAPERLAAEIVATLAPSQRSRVSLVAEPNLPPLRLDRGAASDALANLLRNALTHGGEEGPIVLTVRSDAKGVSFHVRDSGPGIPPRELKQVFQRFYRAPEAVESGRSGFGLGLSIVRQFADAHGGQVSAESVVGRGSTFSMWLPALDPDAAAADADRDPVPEPV